MSISSNNCSFDKLNGTGHSPKNMVLRFFSPETNRGILTTLGVITLLLGLGGGLYLRWAETSADAPNLRLTRTSSQPEPTLKFVQTESMGALSISAGFLNDFFVLTGKALSYYRLIDSPDNELLIKERYTISLEKTPTASCFVMRPDSPFYGDLFVAFADTIELYDPETMKFSPYIDLAPNANVTGMTTDGFDLFAADAGLGRLYRIDEEKNITPWGLPDEQTGFDGFLSGRYSFFDLDVDSKSETIYVTHPDKFRIEAFSALDGHWKEEESFEKAPSSDDVESESFTGAGNPASIIILGDGSFLTTDAGPTPNVKNWRRDGSFQAEINSSVIAAPIAADQAPLASITFTESRAVRLLILLPTGKLVCLTVP